MQTNTAALNVLRKALDTLQVQPLLPLAPSEIAAVDYMKQIEALHNKTDFRPLNAIGPKSRAFGPRDIERMLYEVAKQVEDFPKEFTWKYRIASYITGVEKLLGADWTVGLLLRCLPFVLYKSGSCTEKQLGPMAKLMIRDPKFIGCTRTDNYWPAVYCLMRNDPDVDVGKLRALAEKVRPQPLLDSVIYRTGALFFDWVDNHSRTTQTPTPASTDQEDTTPSPSLSQSSSSCSSSNWPSCSDPPLTFTTNTIRAFAVRVPFLTPREPAANARSPAFRSYWKAWESSPTQRAVALLAAVAGKTDVDDPLDRLRQVFRSTGSADASEEMEGWIDRCMGYFPDEVVAEASHTQREKMRALLNMCTEACRRPGVFIHNLRGIMAEDAAMHAPVDPPPGSSSSSGLLATSSASANAVASSSSATSASVGALQSDSGAGASSSSSALFTPSGGSQLSASLLTSPSASNASVAPLSSSAASSARSGSLPAPLSSSASQMTSSSSVSSGKRSDEKAPQMPRWQYESGLSKDEQERLSKAGVPLDILTGWHDYLWPSHLVCKEHELTNHAFTGLNAHEMPEFSTLVGEDAKALASTPFVVSNRTDLLKWINARCEGLSGGRIALASRPLEHLEPLVQTFKHLATSTPFLVQMQGVLRALLLHAKLLLVAEPLGEKPSPPDYRTLCGWLPHMDQTSIGFVQRMESIAQWVYVADTLVRKDSKNEVGKAIETWSRGKNVNTLTRALNAIVNLGKDDPWFVALASSCKADTTRGISAEEPWLQVQSEGSSLAELFNTGEKVAARRVLWLVAPNVLHALDDEKQPRGYSSMVHELGSTLNLDNWKEEADAMRAKQAEDARNAQSFLKTAFDKVGSYIWSGSTDATVQSPPQARALVADATGSNAPTATNSPVSSPNTDTTLLVEPLTLPPPSSSAPAASASATSTLLGDLSMSSSAYPNLRGTGAPAASSSSSSASSGSSVADGPASVPAMMSSSAFPPPSIRATKNGQGAVASASSSSSSSAVALADGELAHDTMALKRTRWVIGFTKNPLKSRQPVPAFAKSESREDMQIDYAEWKKVDGFESVEMKPATFKHNAATLRYFDSRDHALAAMKQMH